MSQVLGISLPATWNALPLKAVTSLLSRGAAPTYVDDGPVRAISQASNQRRGIDWDRTRFHDHVGDVAKVRGILRPADVIINSTGTGTLGRVGFFQPPPDGIPCMADSHITIARFAPHDVHPRFAYYWMSSSPFQEYAYTALAVGATNQIELNRDRLAAAPMPLPALDEQRRIAEFLDGEVARIDRLSELQGSVIRKLDERDRSLRDELIDRLWTTAGCLPLRRFMLRIEQGSSPQCEAVPRSSVDEWAVLKLSAVKRGSFDPLENKRLPADIEPVMAHEIREGDLLITRANTPSLVGDVATVKAAVRKLLLPDLIYRVTLAEGVEADYVSQVALGTRARLQIEGAARGTSQSMVKLRGEDIKEWRVPNASRAQQIEFVETLRKSLSMTGGLRKAIDRQLDVLAERRHTIITAAVTGQIDVPTASGRGIED